MPKRLDMDDFEDDMQIVRSPNPLLRAKERDINLKDLDYPFKTEKWKKVLEVQDELDKVAAVIIYYSEYLFHFYQKIKFNLGAG